jgi:tetratricopeptide (TPR) repeat protein
MPGLVSPLAALLRGEVPPEGSLSLGGDVLHAVLVHLMRALGAERPIAWVVEDLHFATAEDRKILLSLARAVEGHRVLLFLTTRPALTAEEMEVFARPGNFRRIGLARLGARDVVLLLRDALRNERLVEKLAPRIAEKSDGVPFFVFEMIRGLKEGQFIEATVDGSWIESKVIDEIPVPETMKGLLRVRLGDLAKVEREIVDVGAVLGHEFDPDLVAAVLERKPVAVLQDLAEVERRSGVVRSVGRRCRFDHHQIREILYEGLSERLREEYHGLVAEAIEAGARGSRDPDPARDGERAVAIAEHALRGVRKDRALPHLLSALEYLGEGYENERAIALADRALAVPGLIEGEARLVVLLGEEERLSLLGLRKVQEKVLAEARTLAESVGKASLAKVERAAGKLCQATQRYAEAEAHAERHLALVREIGDRRGEGGATGDLGRLHAQQGRYAEATADLGRSLAIAREIGDRQLEAAASGGLGGVYRWRGQYAEAIAHQERKLALAREIGDRRREAAATGSIGIVYTQQGRYAEAMANYECWLTNARETGNLLIEGTCLANLGALLQLLGDNARARSTLDASLELLRAVAARKGEGDALEGLGAVAEQDGDVAAACSRYGDALALRRDIGYRQGVARVLVSLGSLARRSGDIPTATGHLDEAVVVAREIEVHGILFLALAERALLSGGDAGAAREALAEAGERCPIRERMRARFLLWQAMGDEADLTEARRLLDLLVEHAPVEYRVSMLENVPLHREIMAASSTCGSGG